MQINQFQNSQLKEFYLKAKMDIELIETNILINKEKYDGSDFWTIMHNKHSKYEKELFNTINWEEVSSSVVGIEIGFEKQVIKLLKFLEMWIWCSIKQITYLTVTG